MEIKDTTRTGRAKQQRSLETMSSFLQAAGEIFDEYGYAGATLTMMQERAKVSRASVYYHFGSKEAVAERLLATQVEMSVAAEHPIKLQEIIDTTFLIGDLIKTNALLRGSIRLTTDQGTPFSIDTSTPYTSWLVHGQALLEQARAQGELLVTVDPARSAQMLIGSFVGTQLLSKAMSDREDLRERLCVFYQHFLPALAIPGLIPVLDISPDRRVYEKAAANSPELKAS
ncbi:ScbR family autoregulator-binding transcription factor [Streptomyces sp. NPDC101062]|uniref:ScbR family autoregulator-binding transcription factor n=1 Tax=unclassified Streptomyces TaxID=2593676 RepID=UPI00382376B5